VVLATNGGLDINDFAAFMKKSRGTRRFRRGAGTVVEELLSRNYSVGADGRLRACGQPRGAGIRTAVRLQPTGALRATHSSSGNSRFSYSLYVSLVGDRQFNLQFVIAADLSNEPRVLRVGAGHHEGAVLLLHRHDLEGPGHVWRRSRRLRERS